MIITPARRRLKLAAAGDLLAVLLMLRHYVYNMPLGSSPASIGEESSMLLRTRTWLGTLELLRNALQPLLLSVGTVTGLAVVVGFIGLLPDIQKASESWPASARQCCFIRQGNLVIAACHAAPIHATQGWRYFLACSEFGNLPQVPSAWSELSPSCITPGPGNNIFVGCWDGNIYSIDASNAAAPPERIVRDPTVVPDVMGCSADGVLVVAGYKRITAWDIHAKSRLWIRSLIAPCLAIHPSGQTVVFGTNDGQLLELDLRSGLTRRSVRLRSELVALRFSPDGQYLAVVEWQGQLTLLHWPSLSPAWDREPCRCGVGSFVAFSPNGRLLATTGRKSRSIVIWDAATGTSKCQCSEGDSLVFGGAFVDDLHLASWTFDGIVRFWDASSGALQREIVVNNLEPAS
jgi:putative pyrroloquinoline-quinone binding quinoprotein/WD40 domain-containing protein